MGSKIKVGYNPCLHAMPLVYALQRNAPEYELFEERPARLADMLEDGRLDVALVPSIEYFRHKNFLILPDMSISSKRESENARLFSRVDAEKIASAALDEDARTAAALVRIFLKEKYGLTPVYSMLGQEDPRKLDVDAFLLFGDRGLTYDGSGLKVLDMGEEWWRFAWLPMVYAIWVTRFGMDLRGVDKELQMAKRHGVKMLREIAKEEAPRLGLPEARVRRHLEEKMIYDLSNIELGGLQTFYKYALKGELAEDGVDLDFYW